MLAEPISYLVDGARHAATTPVTDTLGRAGQGTTTLDGNVIRVRDNVLITIEEASDPRVRGPETAEHDFDGLPSRSR